jgi:hypothetical protein
MRPALKPALSRLWRDETTLQLGVDPTRAVVLTDLSPGDRTFLNRLDGTSGLELLLSESRDPLAAARLLGYLGDAGALDDLASPAQGLRPVERQRLGPDLASLSLVHPAPGAAAKVLARRRARRIHIIGSGRVATIAASLLAAAGVGQVTNIVADGAGATVAPGDVVPGGFRSQDVGRSRRSAAAAAIARAAVAPGRTGSAAPLIMIASDRMEEVSADLASPAREAGHPLLVVGVRETTGVVGPLVLPGRSSCLRCQDLHRRDRDPGWARLAAQMSRPPAAVPPCDVVLASLTAAMAALQALTFLDADVPADPARASRQAPDLPVLGGSVELTLPDWRWRRRSWPAHPSCGCGVADSPPTLEPTDARTKRDWHQRPPAPQRQ